MFRFCTGTSGLVLIKSCLKQILDDCGLNLCEINLGFSSENTSYITVIWKKRYTERDTSAHALRWCLLKMIKKLLNYRMFFAFAFNAKSFAIAILVFFIFLRLPLAQKALQLTF